MEFRVKSLRVEKFVDYNERDGENEGALRYILNCETGTGYKLQRWEVRLWTHEGDCYSGWCAASYGNGEVQKVKNFIGMTHKPKKDLKFEMSVTNDFEELPDMNNDVFSLDYNGGDTYYASGWATIDMDLFEEIERNKELRPVWVFNGNSCLGKTYLAQMIANSNFSKVIYETDSEEELPDDISADIIVLGNKYPFTIDEIEKHIKTEHELITVKFETR